jgi:DNA excision repair protein ERCC-2
MTIRTENKKILLSVGDLIRLNTKFRKVLSAFPLPQRGILGRQAQIKIQQRRSDSYGLFHHEYRVHHIFNYKGYEFVVQGRIDGLYEISGRIEVEEIKSVVLSAKDFKALKIENYPEFAEQVLIYCYLLYQEKEQMEIKPILTLVNIVNDKLKTFHLRFRPLEIKKIIEQSFRQIIESDKNKDNILRSRLKQLEKTKFTLAEKREQQEEMMTTFKHCLENNEHLLVSAPTGTGKTAAVLYPAIQYAIKNGKRIAFLTSKTTQQAMVRDTIQPLINDGLDLNISFLRATKNMCANDILFCHEDYCPYAKYYQEDIKRSQLLAELKKEKLLSPDIVFERARKYKLCPAEAMIDAAIGADILVCDYNYLFDPRIQLRRIFNEYDLRNWILIIDEAHNLYPRTMTSLSPQIKRQTLTGLFPLIINDKLKVYRSLKESLLTIEHLFESLQQEGEIQHSNQRFYILELDIQAWQSAFQNFESAFIKYIIFKIRKNLLILDDPLDFFYYQFRGFLQIAEIQDKAFITFYDAIQGGILKIQCCDPSEHIKGIIQKFYSVVGMSATLDPIEYYKKILGFPDECTRLLEVSSPFPNRNRRIVIIPNISTYYRDRSDLFPRYAEIVREIISLKEGNYIVFCPSFEFLQTMVLFLGLTQSEILLQRPQMLEEDRDHLISQLKDGKNPTLLLAVMGGIFSEGIDFSGEMCIGVIIFSPAIPPVSFERELIRQYYENKFGNGSDYAYLYPGLNKVIQSAGRLIRSNQDRGIIVLAGERFADEEINQLFPTYWFEKKGDIVITDKYTESIKEFWERFEE